MDYATSLHVGISLLSHGLGTRLMVSLSLLQWFENKADEKLCVSYI